MQYYGKILNYGRQDRADILKGSDNIQYKQCTRCQQWFLNSDEYFYKQYKKDGSFRLKHWCKKCEKEVSLSRHNKIKKDLALKNGIKYYIIIDCRKSELDFIKNNIINSKLNIFFNLNNVNWLKCHEYACNSLVKKVCDLWNNGIKNTNNISKQMKLSRGTIIRYLKIGTDLKWCNYNSKTAMKKAGKQQGKNNCKKIVCLTTGEFFSSATEACNKYNLHISNVSKCCKGECKSAGKHPITGEPLRWMYYEDWLKLQESNDKTPARELAIS